MGPPIVIASNRGPLSFRLEDGRAVPIRGAGGLVSGLAPLADRSDTTWVAAAVTDADRAAAAAGPVEAAGFRVDMLALPPGDYADAYDVVSNGSLWFAHHRLFDLAREPAIDDRWWAAWASYRRVNDAFAQHICGHAPPDAVVLVQDYHLSLVGATVRRQRPDLRLVHFHHTPFGAPQDLAALPDAAVAELLAGLAGHDACGFHTRRWADAFLACCARYGVAPPPTFVAPLAVDAEDLARAASSEACAAELATLTARTGDLAVIARVDRIELSKNLLRGFRAYDLLLERSPTWRGAVTFVACCYPSRQGVPAYAAYRNEVEALVADINRRWSTPEWTPLHWFADDDYPRSVAALRRADVVLVNALRDGLNLVAKEAALVGERDPSVVLSVEAGAAAEIGAFCDLIQPTDVAATADALDRALRRTAAERAAMAEGRRRAVLARTPRQWLDDQLRAAAG